MEGIHGFRSFVAFHLIINNRKVVFCFGTCNDLEIMKVSFDRLIYVIVILQWTIVEALILLVDTQFTFKPKLKSLFNSRCHTRIKFGVFCSSSIY